MSPAFLYRGRYIIQFTQRSAKFEKQLACGTKSVLSVFLETAGDDTAKYCGRGRVIIRQGIRGPVQDRGDRIALVALVERRAARNHLEKNDAETPDVGARIDDLS